MTCSRCSRQLPQLDPVDRDRVRSDVQPCRVDVDRLLVVTHRSVFDPPSTIAQAIDAVDAFLESPSARILMPSPGHWSLLRASIVASGATGNLVFDAQIAALCREHGVECLLSEDRDFKRFPALTLVTLDVAPGSN